MKAAIVARDETETGERMLLNLGHTFGHALEAACGFSDKLLHGEAIAIGMVLAFSYSEGRGMCGAGTAERVEAHLRAVGLPTRMGEVEGLRGVGAGQAGGADAAGQEGGGGAGDADFGPGGGGGRGGAGGELGGDFGVVGGGGLTLWRRPECHEFTLDIFSL